ncbi:MAG: M20/M25/M40 family metallo-hydrolase [Fimbriimonadaceae bacterium]
MISKEELLALHADLIRINSVSHYETEIADFVFNLLTQNGITPTRIGNNIIAQTSDKPKLLLNSHLDTVPPNDGWTRKPWNPTQIGDQIFGLGSNDTKGCVAAMLTTFVNNKNTPGLALLLSPEEETGGQGTEHAWPILRDEHNWNPEAIIVGEPTELQIGTVQRGLLLLDLVAKGTASHAANADPSGKTNPIFTLARDLAKLQNIKLTPHPLLGEPTIQPTTLQGAEARNQVPAEARASLDIRTVPNQTHEEIIDLLTDTLESNIEIRSKRLAPFACDPNARIIQTIQSLLPIAKPFASKTMSDQVHFAGFNAIKFGPGVSARSHTADEFILASEVIAGANAYDQIIKEFLS